MEYNDYVVLGLNALMMKYLGDQFHWYGSKRYPALNELLSFVSEVEALYQSNDTARSNYSIHIILSDTYYITGNLEKALDWLPKPNVRSRMTYLSSWRCDLKYALGIDIDSYDLLTLFSKRLTNYAMRNLHAIEANINSELAERKHAFEKSILDYAIASDHLEKKWFHTIYGATFYSKNSLLQDSYCFEKSEALIQLAMDIMRSAENQLRENNGIPKVSEGWVAETELYYSIKKAFPNSEVIHQAKPKWLGKQHLDIYIPELAAAIEYQGLQHDAPVAYFGGSAAHIKIRKRDSRKKAVCTRNRIRLIYVRPGYSLEDVIAAIKNEK